MRHLRLIIITIAAIFVLALAALALVNRAPQIPGDDVIIIKGGSLEIQCGKNHGNDCLGTSDGKGKYKHKKDTAHIMEIVVRDSKGAALYTSSFDAGHQPQIEITYK